MKKMKHAIKTRFLAIILACMAISAAIVCADDNTDKTANNQTSELKWGPIQLGFGLSLSPDNQSYGYMEPVRLTVVLSNTTGKALTALRAVEREQFKMRVLDSGGNEVPLTRYGQRQRDDLFGHSLYSFNVPPGGIFKEEILINRWYDMSMRGTYSIEIARVIHNEMEKEWSFVTSNVVRLQIGP